MTRAEAEEKLRMEHELQHSRKLPMKDDVGGMACILWPTVTLVASGHFLIITSLWFSYFFCVVLHPFRHILDILNTTLEDVFNNFGNI